MNLLKNLVVLTALLAGTGLAAGKTKAKDTSGVKTKDANAGLGKPGGNKDITIDSGDHHMDKSGKKISKKETLDLHIIADSSDDKEGKGDLNDVIEGIIENDMPGSNGSEDEDDDDNTIYIFKHSVSEEVTETGDDDDSDEANDSKGKAPSVNDAASDSDEESASDSAQDEGDDDEDDEDDNGKDGGEDAKSTPAPTASAPVPAATPSVAKPLAAKPASPTGLKPSGTKSVATAVSGRRAKGDASFVSLTLPLSMLPIALYLIF